MLALAMLFFAFNDNPGAANTSWLQWGGPNRNFQVSGQGLHWKGSAPRKAWERELGDGYSAVLGDGKTLYATFRRGDSEVVAALDAASGKTRWEQVFESKLLPNMFLDYGKGPNATPALVGGKLFVPLFTGQLYALDINSGKTLWKRDLWGELKGTFRDVGYSNSPLALGELLILPVGGKGKGLAAFRQSDGSTAWMNSDLSNAMSSPILINVDGQSQIVAFMVEGVAGIDPKDGKQLWFHSHKTQYEVNAATPVWHAKSKTLVVSSAYDGGARAIRLSLQNGKTVPTEAWFSRRMRIHHGNMLVLGDHVYGSNGDFGPAPLTSLDIATGAVAWQDRKFPKSTMVQAGDRTIVLDEDGRLAVAKLSPAGLEVLQEANITTKLSWTAPTLIGNKLYVRDRKILAAFELDQAPRK